MFIYFFPKKQATQLPAKNIQLKQPFTQYLAHITPTNNSNNFNTYSSYGLQDILASSYINSNLTVLRKVPVKIHNFNIFVPKKLNFISKDSISLCINDLVLYNNVDMFKKLLFSFFWGTKVTDHRFILLWVRRLWKAIYSNKSQYGISGISICFRGKLSVTGNKRRRTFSVNYGLSSSTKIMSNAKVFYFTIRTTTGVIGVNVSITYNH